MTTIDDWATQMAPMVQPPIPPQRQLGTFQQFLAHRALMSAEPPIDLDAAAAATQACHIEHRAAHVPGVARKLWGLRMAQRVRYVLPGQHDVFTYWAGHAPADHVAACAAMFTQLVTDADPTCPERVRTGWTKLVATGLVVWKVDRLVDRGTRYPTRYPPGPRKLDDVPEHIKDLWSAVVWSDA